MRKTFVLFLFCFIIFKSQAQQVFASSGKDAGNGSIKISYTIGEPLVSKIQNSTISLSNGFQNSSTLIITSTRNNSLVVDDLMVYPNPTSTEIMIGNKSNGKNLSYKMYSTSGNEILSSAFSNESYQTINVCDIPDGTYVLEIHDTISNESKSFKIVKTN